MEYSIKELAKLAGITTRALRYYDEIGLLSPKRVNSNSYRVYSQNEVDLLQQILFYRELGVQLIEIKKILNAKDYNATAALQDHLSALKKRQTQIALLITNVKKTIATSKGEIIMKDIEKFEGFKKEMIDKNEKKYGNEIRERFGDAAIEASNAKVMSLTPNQYKEEQLLSKQINELLKEAFEEGNPASQKSQKVCTLHKEWLEYFWNNYTKEAHLGLAKAYVSDPRFKKYYDDIEDGCAEFLRDAISIYCKETL